MHSQLSTSTKRRTEMLMNKMNLHRATVKRVTQQLRRIGASVQRQNPTQVGYDLLVNGSIRVAVKAARPTLQHKRVSVDGHSYQYQHIAWCFNFHRHGRFRRDQWYADVIVCVQLKAAGQKPLVIPVQNITGKTLIVLKNRRGYAGRYTQYRDAWHHILRDKRAA